MFFVYTKDGQKIKMTHKVDQITALKTGNYLERPPGEPAPVVPALVEGEKVEGIGSLGPEKKKEKDVIVGEIIPKRRVIRTNKE